MDAPRRARRCAVTGRLVDLDEARRAAELRERGIDMRVIIDCAIVEQPDDPLNDELIYQLRTVCRESLPKRVRGPLTIAVLTSCLAEARAEYPDCEHGEGDT